MSQGIRERLTVRGLCALSKHLQEIADAYCPGNLVGILEGGYDLEALAWGVLGTLRVWLGDTDIKTPSAPRRPTRGNQTSRRCWNKCGRCMDCRRNPLTPRLAYKSGSGD